MQRLWAAVVGLVGVFLGAEGCNLFGDIREGFPRDEGGDLGGDGGKACSGAEACACKPGDMLPCYTGAAETQGVGICHGGMKSCDADNLTYGACVGEQVPEAETCDAGEVDEDCDGQVNEEGADCVCGDGYLSEGEGCDDKNLDSTDACTKHCKVAECGDGFVQPGHDETCDDGGISDGDPCSPTCQEQMAQLVAGGGDHTCAVFTCDTVKCWGLNNYGQLGLGDTNNRGDEPEEMGDRLPAIDLGAGATASAVVAGHLHTCALLSDGSVKCWGYNGMGQLGLGDTQWRGDGPDEMGDNLPAVNLGAGKAASAIDAGYKHTCALLNDESVKCWGYNGYGQLGLGDAEPRGDGPDEMGDKLPAVNLGANKKASAIVAGYVHTCALLNDGSVKCWGYNGMGQLGLGDDEPSGDGPNEMGDKLPAVDLGAGKTAPKIAAGHMHTCALLKDGSVKCWGYNAGGQLGLGDMQNRGDQPNEMGDNLPIVKLFSSFW